MLEQTGLAGFTDRLAGTLAYGLQRRAEIARALAGGPSLLLLDEPAAGRTRPSRMRCSRRFGGVRESGGCTIVIVDHDLRLIMRLCDRIHVLAEGRTIGEGTPAEVRANQAVIDAYLGVGGGPSGLDEPERDEDQTEGGGEDHEGTVEAGGVGRGRRCLGTAACGDDDEGDATSAAAEASAEVSSAAAEATSAAESVVSEAESVASEAESAATSAAEEATSAARSRRSSR